MKNKSKCIHKKFFILSSLFLLTLSPIEIQAKECDKTGAEIMKTQETYHQTNSESELQTVILQDLKSGGQPEKREMQRQKTTDSKGLTNSLVNFKSPTSIKGTALLSHEKSGSADDQWIYIPELRKTNRVLPSGKKNYFMQTDFSFADMEDEDIEEYDYTCEKIGKCGKDSCYILTATPKSPTIARNTGYSKRKLWVRNDIFVTIRIKYFNRKGAELKTLTNSKWKKYGKTSWRPRKSVMQRDKEHKTTIETISREVDTPIKESVFTQRYLLKGMHL